MTSIAFQSNLLFTRRLPALALLLATSVVACGGSGGNGAVGQEGGAGPTVVDDSDDDVSPPKPKPTQVDCDARPTETVELDRAFWQTGFKVTLGTATLQPETESCAPGLLTIDATFDNRGLETQVFGARTLLSSAEKDYEPALEQELPSVPGGRTGKGSFAFEVDDSFSFDDAVLSFGDAARLQAKVPLGDDATQALVSLEPQELPVAAELVSGLVEVEIESTMLYGDGPLSYTSLPEDELLLRFFVRAQVSEDTISYRDLGDDAFVLELPDGTSIASDSSLPLITDQGVVEEGRVSFNIPAPAAGDYVLRFSEVLVGDTVGQHPVELAFTLENFPQFGAK